MKFLVSLLLGFFLTLNSWGASNRTLTFYSFQGHTNDRIKMHIVSEGFESSKYNLVSFEYCPIPENCSPIAEGRYLSVQDLASRLDRIRPSMAFKAKRMALAAGVVGPANAGLYEVLFFMGNSIGVINVTPAYHVIVACIGAVSSGFGALVANNGLQNDFQQCQHEMWDAFNHSRDMKAGETGEYNMSVDIRSLASILEKAMTLSR